MPIPRPSFLSCRSRSYDADTKTFERPGTRCLGTRSPHSSARKDSHSTSRDKLSPLAPTFGPRRGIVPSGTLDRRRRGPRYVPFVDQRLLATPGIRDVEPPMGDAKQIVPVAIVISGDEGRRAVWEPGWGYVEVDPASSAEDIEEAVEEVSV
ncbi:hypothetical protein P171DRAFT_478245 [Karstenula rhodostoma CBS 690.94]|uniref:Uncharacterized protein n=1 Tax=Karstenula rhodostoma CBS 690.94 TaxID=1392251 RepID=A0A9P4UJ10_9PLEO|nr:hypothetical protein P171DRAFT_478245 [Karstenula rhodostoma CBS 690.94]